MADNFPFLIFLSGILAGFLNTVAGGGSLLVLPLLVFSGLDMGVANATNRVAILLQSVTASRSFIRGGALETREMLPVALVASLGSLAGTLVAIKLDENALRGVIGLVILLMAFLLVFRPTMWEERRAIRLPHWLMVVIFFLIGIYGGFVQAGVGFFLIWALAGLGGRDLVQANAAKSFYRWVLHGGQPGAFCFERDGPPGNGADSCLRQHDRGSPGGPFYAYHG